MITAEVNAMRVWDATKAEARAKEAWKVAEATSAWAATTLSKPSAWAAKTTWTWAAAEAKATALAWTVAAAKTKEEEVTATNDWIAASEVAWAAEKAKGWM